VQVYFPRFPASKQRYACSDRVEFWLNNRPGVRKEVFKMFTAVQAFPAAWRIGLRPFRQVLEMKKYLNDRPTVRQEFRRI
jgi:hypothetical protein